MGLVLRQRAKVERRLIVLFLGKGLRQGDMKLAALALCAFYPDSAAMLGHDMLADGQAEPRALEPAPRAAVDLVKTVEDRCV